MEPTIVPSTWTIVKFIEDNSVAAVPTKWIRNEECVWPPFPPHKLHITVKNQTSADPLWPSYKVHIFRNATYDTYEKALSKAKLAEDTSDLGTETDEYSQKKRRKIIKKKQIISETDSSSDSADNANIIPSKLPPPPTLYPLVNVQPTLQIDQLSSGDNNDDVPLAANKEVIPIRDSCNFGTLGIQSLRESATENFFPSPSVSLHEKNKDTPGNRRQNMTEVVTPQGPSTSRDCQCTCCPKHIEVNKQILRQLYFLRSLTSDIMDEIRRKHQDTVQTSNTESIFQKFNFPLGSEEDLAAFNLYLEEEKNFNDAVDEIAKFGGKNAYEFVKRALSALMKNDLATGYSWLGRREKKSFCVTKIARLIIKSSEKLNANQKESEVAIQGWLKRAPERAKKD